MESVPFEAKGVDAASGHLAGIDKVPIRPGRRGCPWMKTPDGTPEPKSSTSPGV